MYKMNPNWLGDATISIPNNTIVVNGVPVNAVPNVAGTTSNKSTWADTNFYTFFTSPTVPAGTYLVGMENFTDPLLSSNAGAGWNQGDFFLSQIKDKDGLATLSPQNFIRPYTTGVQVSAAAPYNKGTTDNTTTGILVLGSNTNIVWQAYFSKDAATAYPQTRKLTVESPWYQKIA
jgi:hypothetical protein